MIAVAITCSLPGYAQTGRQVTGVVQDSSGTLLRWVTVKLLAGKDSSVVATNTNGRFTFYPVVASEFSLVISSIGYQGIKRRYNLAPGNTSAELDPIILRSDIITLEHVTITNVNAIRIKEDTVEYNAAAYKVREGAAVEEALKKMPGLNVDRNGNITAQGKQVNKARLNGKDYMAGDVTSLTRNLPADVVQNVQVIDDYGEQANITGIKTGDAQKVLNINIRKEKNYGYLAQATAGSGRDAMPVTSGTKNDVRYAASTNIFIFHGSRQVSITGGVNNTNANLFNFGGGPGGKRGGGMPGLFVAGQDGISTTRSIGFNYRDDWGKKLSVYGSYSFSNNSVFINSTTVRDNLSAQSPSTQTSISTRNDRNLDHRFNFNFEYKPDTVNYFKFTQTFSYNGMHTNETFASKLQANDAGNTLISDFTGRLLSHTSEPDYGLGALYNHRFRKRGRNLSILTTVSTRPGTRYQNPVYNYLAGKANTPVNQVINTDISKDSAGVSFSFLEPVGKTAHLEFNYGYYNTHTTSRRLTDTFTKTGEVIRYTALSNDYGFNFITNRLGVNYRVMDKKYNLTLGLSAQPTLLQGSSLTMTPTRKAVFNFSPVLRYVYNFSSLQALSFNYLGTGNSPAYYELQPVIDFSNANYPVQGNPYLLPEFDNTFQLTYNQFSSGTGNVLFADLKFTQTKNKIVANTVTYPGNYVTIPTLASAILTRYQNASGSYTASAYYVYARHLADPIYTLFFNGTIACNNNISYLTEIVDSLGSNQTTRKNIAKNLVFIQGTRFRVDITDVVDAEVNASYSVNHSNNAVPETPVSNNFQAITLGASAKHYFRDWTLSYDYSKVTYKGYKGATNPNVLNTYMERRFLKNNMATVRIAVYDVFNENTGFTSTQNAYSITQSRVNRLGRYFLLTFTIRLQKFAGELPMGAPGAEGGGG